MTNESLSISELIPARPDQIYAAWMNSDDHTAFTGDAAVDPVVGGEYSAFGGYATGTTLDLLEGRRIVQTWRTTQFPDGSPDSRLEVTMEETVGGTMVTILHTEIPSGQSNTYRHGWEKYYLGALKRYFTRGEAEAKTAEAAAQKEPVSATKNAGSPAILVVSAGKAKNSVRTEAEAAPTRDAKKKAAPKRAAKRKAAPKLAAKKKAAPKPAAKKKAAPKLAAKKKAAPKPAAKKKAAPKRRAKSRSSRR